MKNEEAIRFRYSVCYTLSFVALLWVVKALEWALSYDFGVFGIHPRTLLGTFGILTGPLIHGNLMHLLSNSFPLILLGIAVFYFYSKIAIDVFLWVYLMTGAWVWLFARDAYHIGASGIVYGLVAFLFFSGIFRRDTRSTVIALIVIFLYGGMVYGVIPGDPHISWESHLMGSLNGMFCAFYFRKEVMPGAVEVLAPIEEGEWEEEETPETMEHDRSWSNSSENPQIRYTYTYIRKNTSETKKQSN